jgi:nitrite reductase (cytochrome c-552)
MLYDQEQTERILKRPQVGSCLHCHASVRPLYRELGNGDAIKGFEESHKLDYKNANEMLRKLGSVDGQGKRTEGAHPISCVDCHDPDSMQLRVTRPGFILGIRDLAAGNAPVALLPSIESWRRGNRARPYDPNVDATRQEMRSFVCAQCHVEYYCGAKAPLFFPWAEGLKVEQIEKYLDNHKFPDGTPFFDWKHAETGAAVYKAQHPEFELWSQGVHARSGVSCADCHMPYMREGATKISDHWVRSPLLNINRACQTCHRFPEEEIKARVELIQQRNYDLLERAAAATVGMLDAIKAAKEAGASDEQLAAALALQRKAQWRLDFVAAENSMGFHAPQEAGRILAEAIDYARQAELAAMSVRGRIPATQPVAMW